MKQIHSESQIHCACAPLTKYFCTTSIHSVDLFHCDKHSRVYSNLEDRKKCRENTWHEADWNEVVANTVPLIRTMSTRILEPLPFSPTQ